MSYKIQYSPETGYLYPQVRKQRTIHMKSWILPATAIVLALWLHFYGVPDFFIPGDPDVTKAATSVLVNEIQSGIAVNDAVTTFCKTILDGAEITN